MWIGRTAGTISDITCRDLDNHFSCLSSINDIQIKFGCGAEACYIANCSLNMYGLLGMDSLKSTDV